VEMANMMKNTITAKKLRMYSIGVREVAIGFILIRI